MAFNYVCDGFSQHDVENGRMTLRFLRRTPSQNSAHFPSWGMSMRYEVIKIATNLVKMGRQNPNARMTISADSGLSNGLAIELHITGIEVLEDGQRLYLSEMRQYLKKMSMAALADVQTARIETSRGQQRSQVIEMQNVAPRGIVWEHCEAAFGSIAIVSNDVPLRQDNSVIGLYEASGYIPSAFLPGICIPLNIISADISVFVPQSSFNPYVVRWSLIPKNGVYLMVATPDISGCVTGLLPFLLESDVALFLEDISRRTLKRLINPPLLNRRAVNEPPVFRAAQSSSPPCAASDSDYRMLPTRSRGRNVNQEVPFERTSANE